MSEEAEEEEGPKRRGANSLRHEQKSHLEKLMANPVDTVDTYSASNRAEQTF